MSSDAKNWYISKNDGQYAKVSFHEGMKWQDVQKNVQNENISSIWNSIDNGDGVMQQNEIDDLEKVLSSSIKSAGNKNIGEAPANPKFDYRFSLGNNELKALEHISDDDIKKITSLKGDEDYEYQIKENSDNTAYSLVKVYKNQGSPSRTTQNWSEGLDRQISTISVSAYDSSFEDSKSFESETPIEKQAAVVAQELEQIGKEVGFETRRISGTGEGQWFEDYGIRRADGKMLVVSPDAAGNVKELSDDKHNKIISHRENISVAGQGGAALYADDMEKSIPGSDVVHSKSYLEGGNVLNTCKADGSPAAVVGSESVDYTLAAMGLEKSKKNIEIAKKQIADDLGLKVEDVTFMNQFDMHIDMDYRPLHDGEMAVPDYEEGIRMLQQTEISGMSSDEKQKLIQSLQEKNEKTADIRRQAEKSLQKDGYKIVKIPCFDTNDSQINFMNGVGGTSKSGQSFYITNKSNYPELNTEIQKYFKKAGVDKVYFVSSTEFLKKSGGIDCLTQES